MNFLPHGPRRSPLALAAPLCCGLAAAGAALVALWGLGRAGRAVAVELPKVESGAEPLAANFRGHVITVRNDGGCVLGGGRLPWSELRLRLEKLGKLPTARSERVLIRADAHAPFGKVAALLELCRRSGLSVRFEVVEESSP